MLPLAVLAEGTPSRTCKPAVRVSISQDQTIRVEASQTPLSEVLAELERTLGVRMHSAVLPEPRVSASCAGTDMRQMMECLAGSDADLILRYPEGKRAANSRPEEIWLLRTGLAATAPADSCARNPQPDLADVRPAPAEPDRTGQIMELAASEDPERRAQGLSRLIAEGAADEATAQQTLETALTDRDPKVRAQAVYGLARQGGEGVAAMLQQALRDDDVSVRLMAVDSAGSDAQGIALLKQALADSDETVSGLAAMKLEPKTTSAGSTNN